MRCFNGFTVLHQIDIFILTVVVNLLCLHIAGIPNLVLARQPVSGLCRDASLSCSNQMPLDDPNEECSMTYFERSACDISPNKEIVSSTSEEYGAMQLNSYLYVDSKNSILSLAAFNVSFTKIKWTHLRMWFLKETREGENKTLPNACREFKVPSNLSLDTVLFFDCLWLKARDTEGSVYKFQYEVLASPGLPSLHTFLFKHPFSSQMSPNTAVSDWQLFLLVEISDLRKLQLQIQAVPSRFNVTRYSVHLWRSTDESSSGNEWVVFSQVITVPHNTTEHTILKTRLYDTMNKPGTHKYTVTIDHPSCDINKNPCITEAPKVYIVPSCPASVLIGIVGVVVMVPMLIAGFFIWRRSCIVKPPDEPRQPKKILLIYNPYYPSHVDNVIGFNHYLRDSCNLDPMLDLYCIPGSDSRDPTQWYLTEAFKKAENILVLASPPGQPSTVPHRLNTYLHLDKIAMNQLRLRLSLKEPHSHAVSVKLPQCTWDTLPLEARDLRKFMLPRDMDPLLVYLGSAPKYDNGASLLAALQEASALPPPARQTAPFTISQHFPETSSAPRTPLDPDGRELILSGDDYEEELRPLFNNTVGRSLNLNLNGGNCR